LKIIIGDPLEVLPRLLNILYSKFDGHINEKGFKVLDKHVRIIQGDGVNMKSIKEILDLLEKNGFASDNLVFGSGGMFLINLFVFFLMKIVRFLRWSFTKI
jgi:nicotinamide phosphoribosyltransferase